MVKAGYATLKLAPSMSKYTPPLHSLKSTDYKNILRSLQTNAMESFPQNFRPIGAVVLEKNPDKQTDMLLLYYINIDLVDI